MCAFIYSVWLRVTESIEIKIKCGESFNISLESNATTGYQWIPEYDAGMLDLIESKYIVQGEGIGAGGVEIFTLKPKLVEEIKIRFIYKREWEDHHIEEKEYLIHAV